MGQHTPAQLKRKIHRLFLLLGLATAYPAAHAGYGYELLIAPTNPTSLDMCHELSRAFFREINLLSKEHNACLARFEWSFDNPDIDKCDKAACQSIHTHQRLANIKRESQDRLCSARVAQYQEEQAKKREAEREAKRRLEQEQERLRQEQARRDTEERERKAAELVQAQQAKAQVDRSRQEQARQEQAQRDKAAADAAAAQGRTQAALDLAKLQAQQNEIKAQAIVSMVGLFGGLIADSIASSRADEAAKRLQAEQMAAQQEAQQEQARREQEEREHQRELAAQAKAAKDRTETSIYEELRRRLRQNQTNSPSLDTGKESTTWNPFNINNPFADGRKDRETQTNDTIEVHTPFGKPAANDQGFEKLAQTVRIGQDLAFLPNPFIQEVAGESQENALYAARRTLDTKEEIGGQIDTLRKELESTGETPTPVSSSPPVRTSSTNPFDSSGPSRPSPPRPDVPTYVDPASGQQYQIPSGKVLYRDPGNNQLSVMDRHAPKAMLIPGDKPTQNPADCTADGQGVITPFCEEVRHKRKSGP